VGESGFERGRRVEFGFSDGGEELDSLLEAAEAGGFFFCAADEAVEVVAGGFGQGVEEFYQAVAAEGRGEERVEGHEENLTADDTDYKNFQ
jgi:hypothetical protein